MDTVERGCECKSQHSAGEVYMNILVFKTAHPQNNYAIFASGIGMLGFTGACQPNNWLPIYKMSMEEAR